MRGVSLGDPLARCVPLPGGAVGGTLGIGAAGAFAAGFVVTTGAEITGVALTAAAATPRPCAVPRGSVVLPLTAHPTSASLLVLCLLGS